MGENMVISYVPYQLLELNHLKNPRQIL
jgi:hypothetical protein